MDTCAAALDYYFNAIVVLTVMGVVGWFFAILSLIMLHYMAKHHEAFKVETRSILKETGYIHDE